MFILEAMDCLAFFLHRLTILVFSWWLCQSLFTHSRPQSPSFFLVRYKLNRVAVGTRMLFSQQHNIAWNQALLRGKNGKKRKGNGIKIRRAKLAERLTGEGEREASWPLPRVPLGSPIVFSGFFPYYGAWSQVASHGKERVTHA